jgi:hypothetical protein
LSSPDVCDWYGACCDLEEFMCLYTCSHVRIVTEIFTGIESSQNARRSVKV